MHLNACACKHACVCWCVRCCAVGEGRRKDGVGYGVHTRGRGDVVAVNPLHAPLPMPAPPTHARPPWLLNAGGQRNAHLDRGQHNCGVGVLQARHDALCDALRVLGLLALVRGQRVQDEHLQGRGEGGARGACLPRRT